MAKRGVFAIIIRNGNRILVSERADGKGWDLPGGGIEDGEKDDEGLIREVAEETGLDVEVLHPIGEPLVFNDDTAVAYCCDPVGGQLVATTESKQQRYVDCEEIKELKLVGPDGRMGRMKRMIYDGLSIAEAPTVSACQLPPNLRSTDGILVTDDGLSLFEETETERREWRRIDPYTQSGYMETRYGT